VEEIHRINTTASRRRRSDIGRAMKIMRISKPAYLLIAEAVGDLVCFTGSAAREL